jgi:hypothetical protein
MSLFNLLISRLEVRVLRGSPFLRLNYPPRRDLWQHLATFWQRFFAPEPATTQNQNQLT